MGANTICIKFYISGELKSGSCNDLTNKLSKMEKVSIPLTIEEIQYPSISIMQDLEFNFRDRAS